MNLLHSLSIVLLSSFFCASCVKAPHSAPQSHKKPSTSVKTTSQSTKPAPSPAQKAPHESPKATKNPTPSPQDLCIVLDPGHGGEAKGAKLIIPPYTPEKVLTLMTAKKVDEYLTKWGYKTCMTRTTDVDVSLPKRVALATDFKATLFVSIHYNSTPAPTKASGVEIYFYKKSGDAREKNSKALAHAIMQRIEPASKVTSRGVRHGNFTVIRETKVPAVLIETAFLSNPAEAKKLKKPGHIAFLAWAIAKGIEDYIQQ